MGGLGRGHVDRQRALACHLGPAWGQAGSSSPALLPSLHPLSRPPNPGFSPDAPGASVLEPTPPSTPFLPVTCHGPLFRPDTDLKIGKILSHRDSESKLWIKRRKGVYRVLEMSHLPGRSDAAHFRPLLECSPLREYGRRGGTQGWSWIPLQARPSPAGQGTASRGQSARQARLPHSVGLMSRRG